jgi:hypothetical protein
MIAEDHNLEDYTMSIVSVLFSYHFCLVVAQFSGPETVFAGISVNTLIDEDILNGIPSKVMSYEHCAAYNGCTAREQTISLVFRNYN